MNILLAGSWESFIQLLGVLVIFLFVLAITYLTTRWMGNVQKGKNKNKNLRIVETIGVGSNKMVSIIEAGTKYLVIAIGKEEIHLLAELSEDELKDLSFADETGKGNQSASFADIMDRLKEKLPKKQD